MLEPGGWRMVPRRTDLAADEVRAGLRHHRDNGGHPVGCGIGIVVREADDVGSGVRHACVPSVADALPRSENVSNRYASGPDEVLDLRPGAVARVVVGDDHFPREAIWSELAVQGVQRETK